jgi:hypothetical protein
MNRSGILSRFITGCWMRILEVEHGCSVGCSSGVVHGCSNDAVYGGVNQGTATCFTVEQAG